MVCWQSLAGCGAGIGFYIGMFCCFGALIGGIIDFIRSEFGKKEVQ